MSSGGLSAFFLVALTSLSVRAGDLRQLVIDGTITKDGVPITTPVSFTVSISAGSCVLWVESVSNVTPKNGGIALAIGSAPTYSATSSGVVAEQFEKIFENSNPSSLLCQGSGVIPSLTAYDDRTISISFNDGVNVVNLGSVSVKAVPYALYAASAMEATSADLAVNSQKLAGAALANKGDLVVGLGGGLGTALSVGTNDQVLMADSTAASGLKWATLPAGGTGTVTTVGLSLPSELTVSNSPLTGSGGTMSASWAAQSANRVFAGPATSSSSAPTFRTLVPGDLPSISSGMVGVLPIANGGTGQATSTAAFDALSPLTNKGDILVRDNATNTRLSVGTNNQVLMADDTAASGLKWATLPAGGTGTVTTVEFSAPTGMTVTGSPITSSGTFALAWNSANQGAVFAGPVGAAGPPSFRSLAATDLPSISSGMLGVLPIANGGTGASNFPGNRLIITNGLGTAFQELSCSEGQTISFDASGRVSCSSSHGSLSVNDGTVSAPSISFTYDPDTGIFRTAANTLNFATGGTLRLSINSTGTVSAAGDITAGGSITASSSISVGAGIKLNDGTASAPAYGFTNSANTGMFLTSGNLGLATSGLARLTILAAGNVGIGTTSPAAALHVNGGARVNQIFGSDGTASSPTYTFNSSNSTGFYMPSTSVLGFVVNGSEKLRIDGSGRVGIGTTSPQAALHVNGKIAATNPSGPPLDVDCGTVVAGSSDTRGAIDIGGSSVPYCNITFSALYTSAPFCVVSWSGTTSTNIEIRSETTTTSFLKVGFASNVNSKRFSYICLQ